MRTILVLLVLAACGGDTFTPTPQGDGGSPNNPNCPAAAPQDGTVCTPPLSCTYESGSHGACTVTASCVSTTGQGPFHWSVSKPGPTCGGNPGGCPPSYGSIVPGSSCSAAAMMCDYPEARCECLSCFGDAGAGEEWECRAWTDVGPGCPTDNPPPAGSPCSTAGQTCDYSQLCGISFGADLQCQNGQWVALPMPAGLCVMRTCGK